MKQIQRIVDWLEHCAAESMDVEFLKDAKHFTDEGVAWPNTLGQLLVCIKSYFFNLCHVLARMCIFYNFIIISEKRINISKLWCYGHSVGSRCTQQAVKIYS